MVQAVLHMAAQPMESGPQPSGLMVASIIMPSCLPCTHESFEQELTREPSAVTKAASDVATFIHMEIIHEYMIRMSFFRVPKLL